MPERIPALCCLCGLGPTKGFVVLLKSTFPRHEVEVGRSGLCQRCYIGLARAQGVFLRFEPLNLGGARSAIELAAPADGDHLR
jgi:hypothetical protein